jgi:HEPN domain-containing protein
LNRIDFQNLAQERLDDGKAMLAAGRNSAAFYIVGYAVECALKACIAKKTGAGDWPPPANEIRDGYYTHDVKKLLRVAGLETDCRTRSASNVNFANNWATVSEWNEERRYESGTSFQRASELINAIEDVTDGILPWLQMHW